MYNPYLSPIETAVRPLPQRERKQSHSLQNRIAGRLRSLDNDDLLIMLILYLLLRRSCQDRTIPILAVLLYCML
ncbi:MAG: hypothetical protein PUC06_10125 [Oscillospiraceae bacterium]|nr:hypothetical protein [Oscillospiraceae bacterium]